MEVATKIDNDRATVNGLCDSWNIRSDDKSRKAFVFARSYLGTVRGLVIPKYA